MRVFLRLLPLAAVLSSCMKGDEELQKQLIELRGSVEAKTKTVEQLQAQVADLQSKNQRTSSSAPGASAEDLAKAKTRIAELEQRVASVSANPAAPQQISKLDMDEMAGKLEEDLTRKAKQLRELVQKQSPGSRIDEISLKSIEYPPQLVTPFSSAITFTVNPGNGSPMRLMFPVTADLGGSWKLPTPDEIQKAYKAAQEQPAPTVATTGTQGGQAQPQAQAQPSAAASGGAGARMTRRADGVFVFDWGDGSAAQQARQPQPAPAPQQAYAPSPPPAVGGPQTFNNFVPPGQTGVPQPGAPAAPRAPAPAAPAPPAAPNVPPPVMPIVGDRIIRF